MKKCLRLIFTCMVLFFTLNSVSYAGFADDLRNLRDDLLNGETDSDGKSTWIVPEGFVVGYGSNAILVHLRLDQDVIDAFNFNPNVVEHVLDKPLSLEIDLVQHISSGDDELKVSHIKSNMPSSAKVMKDTLLLDNVTDAPNRHTMGSAFISKPYNLQANKDYFIIFYLEDPIPAGGTMMHLNQQVVGSIVGNFGVFVDLIPGLNKFSHFSIETEPFRSFALDNSGHGTYWDDRASSSNCTFSFSGSEVIHSCASGSETETVPSTSTVSEVGVWQGPLCEDGTRDCFYEHLDDSGTSSYPDDTYVDPVTNHKHAIGMHSVRGRLQGHSTWKYEISVEEGTSLHLNMRVKVKEKEDRDWEGVYVDLYYSPNRWFSRTHDTLIETLKIHTLDADEKESRYFDDINISNLEPGNHYYFADIRYGDEHNISSRKDDTEYLKLTVLAPQEPEFVPYYTFNKSETCAGLTYDESDWTFTRYDIQSVFNLNEEIYAITEINNVTVNHKMKMEVYYNGEYWWTEEDSAWRQVTDYWGQSYMWVGQDAEEVGVFTFKTFIDLGNGWEFLDLVSVVVEDPNAPTDPYVFNGTQTCADVTYNETVWQHFVGTPKSVFSLNEEIWVLAEVTDVTTDYRLKIEVWVNGYHWWTEGENSSLTQVNGTEDRVYLHLSQEAEETGTFTFKTFIDTGNGWQSLGETSATVQ